MDGLSKENRRVGKSPENYGFQPPLRLRINDLASIDLALLAREAKEWLPRARHCKEWENFA